MGNILKKYTVNTVFSSIVFHPKPPNNTFTDSWGRESISERIDYKVPGLKRVNKLDVTGISRNVPTILITKLKHIQKTLNSFLVFKANSHGTDRPLPTQPDYSSLCHFTTDKHRLNMT